ncbi:MAG: CBS and ACT domain-containing protein [Pseudomonadota bacterium]
MLVKYWMNKDVIGVDADDSMQKGVNLMKTHAARMLTVMKGKKLVGVVTDRDLKRASASDATSLEIHELLYLISQIRIRDIMTPNVVTVKPDHTLEEAAARLLTNSISGAPVVDEEGHVVGTISQAEIFMALVSLSGYGKQGIQLAFQIEDQPGSVKKVTDIIRNHGGRIASILTSTTRAPAGFRNLYVRAYDVDRSVVETLLDDLRTAADVLYMVDHRENNRIVFADQPSFKRAASKS